MAVVRTTTFRFQMLHNFYFCLDKILFDFWRIKNTVWGGYDVNKNCKVSPSTQLSLTLPYPTPAVSVVCLHLPQENWFQEIYAFEINALWTILAVYLCDILQLPNQPPFFLSTLSCYTFLESS